MFVEVEFVCVCVRACERSVCVLVGVVCVNEG